jgi:hypothetical protein
VEPEEVEQTVSSEPLDDNQVRLDDEQTRLDHDRLFKELITTFFVEFLEAFVPDIPPYLDRDSLEFLDKEVFTDVTDGERHESDIVVRARFQGEERLFLVFVENQSSAQSHFASRMFTYFARFHEKYKVPVYPIAVFSYDAPAREEPSSYAVAFPGFVVNDFRFRVIQLNRLSWRDYLANPNPAATALMSKMRIAAEDRPRVKLECLRLIVNLRLDAARSQMIAGFVRSYLKLSREERVSFEREVRGLPAQEREEMITIHDEWTELGIEQGIERGIERGIEQGITQGELRLALRQLTRKFGQEATEALRPQVAALPFTELESFGEEILYFTTVDEAQAWLESPRDAP